MANNNNTRQQVPGRTAEEAAFERQLAEGAAVVNQAALSSVTALASSDASLPATEQSPPAVSRLDYKEALTKFTPEARQLVAEVAADRQYHRIPARQKRRYKVDGCNEPVEAFDEVEAIAVANDLIKTNRGPRGVKVRELAGV